MINFFSISTLFILLGCLALGFGYAWLLYSSNKNLGSQLRKVLFALRMLTVSIIAFLLFAPLVKRVTHTLEKPIVVIANDNSLSTKSITPAGFDAQKYQQDLTTLSSQLSEKYEVRTYTFGDSVKSGLHFTGTDQITNASVFVKKLNDELLNRNVGAVIMATDGIFNRGGNPLYDLEQINAPFYTVALGDTIPKRDVLISNVNYNNIVYLDNEFNLEVLLQAFESKGEQVTLTVSQNGTKISEQKVSITSSSFTKEVQMKLKANKIGVHRYTLSVSGVKNELTTKNNSQTVYVEVIDARQKVLIAANAPHPDIAVFKQAIAQSKHYEFAIAYADELNSVDLSKFSLVVLYQLPAVGNSATAFIKKVQQQRKSVFYVVGAQSDLHTFNQLQQQITFARVSGALQDVFPVYNEHFSTFVLHPEALKQFSFYDPLQMPFSEMAVEGNYSALITQRIGRVNTQTPTLFFTEENGKKTGYLVGEGIWKWKLEEAKNENSYPLVNDIVGKAIQYLAIKDDKRKFKAFTSKHTFNENENVLLNATLYNDSFEAINTPEAKVQLKNEEGKVFHYTFAKSGSGYQLDAGLLPQGNYTYTASTTLGGRKYEAKGAFFISALIAEFQQTTANHQLLFNMAQQTAGKMYMPNQLLQIADDLEKSGRVKTISYEDRRFEELVNFKWVFFLILSLLTAEWFFRKRNGEV